MAREAIAWGATADVLSVVNLRKARNMAEFWSADAELCALEAEDQQERRA
jgi:zinc/manganese transport system ATP-binding protein